MGEVVCLNDPKSYPVRVPQVGSPKADWFYVTDQTKCDSRYMDEQKRARRLTFLAWMWVTGVRPWSQACGRGTQVPGKQASNREVWLGSERHEFTFLWASPPAARAVQVRGP